jgi:hypothetical protein
MQGMVDDLLSESVASALAPRWFALAGQWPHRQQVLCLVGEPTPPGLQTQQVIGHSLRVRVLQNSESWADWLLAGQHSERLPLSRRWRI